MKTRTLIVGALATLATVAAPMAASAQQWRGDRDRDGRYERWERREDRRDYRRDHRRDHRYDDRRYSGPPYGHAYGHRSRWYRGATIPHSHRSTWYIRDYHRYGYAPPPRGYGYYRTDTGDIVLAAIATGVIISLLNN
jgi:Ni/Co efflux regulator RcnB